MSESLALLLFLTRPLGINNAQRNNSNKHFFTFSVLDTVQVTLEHFIQFSQYPIG